jgi:hypothetical protein
VSWLELDDGILDHPKFVRLVTMVGGDGPFLWLGLRAYCGKQLTDGFIPTDMLIDVRGPRDPKKRAAALAALRTVGLLEEAEGGVQLHDYRQWSRSRADVLESRRRNSERQAKSRGSHTVTDAVTARVVTPSVTLPSSSPLPLPLPLPERDPPPPSVVPPQGGDRDIARGDLNSFAPDPPPRAKKLRKAPSTPFPPDLQPLPRQQEKCRELLLNCAEEFEKFSARHQSTGALFADWHRAFDTWIARAPEFRRPVPAAGFRGGRPQEVSPNVDYDTRAALASSRRVQEFLAGAK